MRSNLIKDWRNGMQHQIPVSANLMLFNVINITPSFNFTDRMYTTKVNRKWDQEKQQEVVADTTHGFYNVYNWNLSLSASTKLYGMYTSSPKLFKKKPWQIRHVINPSLSFSYAHDFSSSRYGYYET